MEGQYSLRSPAVKRLMKEAQELREPTEQFYAQPLDDNLFEWHFTIRGPADTEFDGGIYHGRIILPPEYPMKPPSIILLTPNGRFEIHKKICLSISGYHPESWQPSWSLRTALLAIIGFMPTHGNGAIGSLDYTADERKALAKKSVDWKCDQCGQVKTLLRPVTEASQALNKEAKELGSQIKLQGEKEKPSTSDAGATPANPSAPVTTPPSTSSSTFPAADAAPGAAFPPYFTPFPGAVPPFPANAAAGQAPNGALTFPYPPFSAFALPPGRMPTPFMAPPPFMPPPFMPPPSWPAPSYSMVQSGFFWPPQSISAAAMPPAATTASSPDQVRVPHATPLSSSSVAAVSPSTLSSGAASVETTSQGVIPPATAPPSSSLPVSSATPAGRTSPAANQNTATQQQSSTSATADPSSVPASSSANVPADDDPVLSASEIRRRHVVHREQPANMAAAQPQSGGSQSTSWLVNILVFVLIMFIAILLARRLYLLGTRW